jgi:Ran GTPase-activating protein (RanGAP) involved in mRNA processing and transport
LEGNNLRADSGKALAGALKCNSAITELNIADNDLANSGTVMSGITALADAIPDMGALTKIDISKNSLQSNGCKALAKGLKGNHVITELSLADNNLARYGNMSGVIALADAIPDMGSLLYFDISGNGLKAEGGKILAEAIKGNQVMTTLNIANNSLILASNGYTTDMSGVAALADVMAGMRALASLDISDNNLTDYGENTSGKHECYV